MSRDPGQRVLVLVCDDLLMGSRVREAVRQSTWELETITSAERLSVAIQQAPQLVLVSMALRKLPAVRVIEQCREMGVRCVAFAGHAESELHATARSAGAWRTIANSSVATVLPQLLEHWEKRDEVIP